MRRREKPQGGIAHEQTWDSAPLGYETISAVADVLAFEALELVLDLGGLVIGLSQEMSAPVFAWLAGPDVIGLVNASAYKVAIPFIVMIAVLILRPWGIAGRAPAFTGRVFFIERIAKALGRRRKPTGPLEDESGG